MRGSFCLDFKAGLLSRSHYTSFESCHQFGLSISVQQDKMYTGEGG